MSALCSFHSPCHNEITSSILPQCALMAMPSDVEIHRQDGYICRNHLTSLSFKDTIRLKKTSAVYQNRPVITSIGWGPSALSVRRTRDRRRGDRPFGRDSCRRTLGDRPFVECFVEENSWGQTLWSTLFASALHLETLPFRFDSLNCTTFPSHQWHLVSFHAV